MASSVSFGEYALNWYRYSDDEYEYRHVQLPKDMLKKIPADYFDTSKGTLKLLWEQEWRSLGITQVCSTTLLHFKGMRLPPRPRERDGREKEKKKRKRRAPGGGHKRRTRDPGGGGLQSYTVFPNYYCQSLGWEHYEVHEPEPHILLFK